MTMRGKIFTLVLVPFFGATSFVCGQGAGIGTTTPDASAALHVKESPSDSKGLLIPRWAPDNSTPAADGLLVYNSATGNLSYSAGGTWTEIAPVPSGTVIMWSGAVNALPDGWVLCDGDSYNLQGAKVGSGAGVQTPDLRGRFIVGYSGAGDYSTVGWQYGDKYHALTEAEMPAHTHSVGSGDHNHLISVSASAHTHTFSVSDGPKHNIGGFLPTGLQGVIYTPVTSGQITSAAATPVTVNPATTNVSIGSTGSGAAYDNRPPYYTLAFIMKL